MMGSGGSRQPVSDRSDQPPGQRSKDRRGVPSFMPYEDQGGSCQPHHGCDWQFEGAMPMLGSLEMPPDPVSGKIMAFFFLVLKLSLKNHRGDI